MTPNVKDEDDFFTGSTYRASREYKQKLELQAMAKLLKEENPPTEGELLSSIRLVKSA